MKEKLPKGEDKADTGGEQPSKKIRAGALGKTEAAEDDRQFNTGRTAGICYNHTRKIPGGPN